MTIALRHARRGLLGGAAGLLLATAPGTPGLAQEVTLTAVNGSASISGTLIEFKDGFYVVDTRVGQLRIRAADVTCEGPGCAGAGGGIVRIAGDDTAGEGLLPLLLGGFAGSEGGIVDEKPGETEGETLMSLIAQEGFGDEMGTFSMRTGGSDDAFLALLDRSAEIGVSARRILPAEARALRDAGAGNMIDPSQEHVIAIDSIAVIVHPSNPVTSLTIAQLDEIYSGRVTNWAELGGSDAPITVFAREAGSATSRSFDGIVFAESGRSAKDDVTVVESESAMADAVNGDPNGIGYVSFAFLSGGKPVAITGTCGIASTASAFAAKTEEYPLNRRIYLYNRGDTLSPEAQAFIDFAVSPRADESIAKSGFIDLAIQRVALDETDSRIEDVIRSTVDPTEYGIMRDVLLDMLEFDRLSTTFRFAAGSSRLDGKALADLERLVSYVETQPAGSELMLVGFTDSDGASEANRTLSLGRAEQVARELLSYAGGRLGNVAVTTKGYGELAPATCNDTLDGKRINRRVEVWIRNPA